MIPARQLHKFGGSSLADPECFQRVVKLLAENSQAGDLIVVSAAGKTTNHLIGFLQGLESDGRIAHEAILAIRQWHTELIQNLLSGDVAQTLLALLYQDIEVLESYQAPLSPAQKAQAQGFGEVWSARLLSALLNQAQMPAAMLDSRRFLRAERSAQPEVQQGLSQPLLKALLEGYDAERIVITGFMAQNEQGETVLLGRNGSDYSATVIGAMSEAHTVTIWSDVAGVYSADPRIVDDACLLPLLRLDEASELARLAAPVLHSRTLQPVAQSAMDLNLRCSYQAEAGSTRIERVLASGRGAKIVSSLDEVWIIQLRFANRDSSVDPEVALKQLRRAQLEPLTYEWQADQQCLRLAYTPEIAVGAMSVLQENAIEAEIKLKEGFSLVAAVGAGVTKNPYHSHAFFQQLKHAPVEFISESESALSLVAVLRQTPVANLVIGLHRHLFSAHKRVAVALCGKGNIGSSWLALFAEQQGELNKRYGIDFELVMVADSQRYWFDAKGLDAASAIAEFSQHAIAHQQGDWVTKLGSLSEYDEAVVIDVTASQALSDRYVEFAEQGLHLISANKVAGSASSEDYYRVQDAFEKIGRHWFYNATVGAGLPINHTVRDLKESGDQLIGLSGIFSGTLSWLFQQFDGSVAFSELVDLAWQQGLTEPDPRHDLDGSDVMRKLVILAREAGMSIEPEQVKVESLVPEALSQVSVDAFFDHPEPLNALLEEKLEQAKREGCVLRYVARLRKDGQATVGVEALANDDPLASLLPCDNIFAIESQWYKDNPLVIRGPGAGRLVTAGAIQSDLNRLASRL